MTSQWQTANLQGAIDLGGKTIQSLILVNGAAAAGLLTFWGNLITKGVSPASSVQIANALQNFSYGVFAALLASIFAYLSQLGSATSGLLGRLEIWLRAIAIVCGLFSAGCFLFGVSTGSHALAGIVVTRAAQAQADAVAAHPNAPEPQSATARPAVVRP
jgi:hypothetical protein